MPMLTIYIKRYAKICNVFCDTQYTVFVLNSTNMCLVSFYSECIHYYVILLEFQEKICQKRFHKYIFADNIFFYALKKKMCSLKFV